MNQSRFNSIFSGMSSIAKKVYEVIPGDAYWSIQRIMNEMKAKQMNPQKNIVLGVLNTLANSGLVHETAGQMFSRERVSNNASVNPIIKHLNVTERRPDVVILKAEPVSSEEIKISTFSTEKSPTMTTKEKQTPFDAVREVVIEFMDLAKKVNELAAKLDSRLAATEKHVSKSDESAEKLKQLQQLLKSI